MRRHIAAKPWLVRGFAFHKDMEQVLFKVKAEEVDIAKLAGGMYLRARRQQETILEGMGDKSIQNCVRGVVLANKYIERDRNEGNPEKIPPFYRLGFAPQLRKEDSLYWVSMKVIPFKDPYHFEEGLPGDQLRVGRNAQVEGHAERVGGRLRDFSNLKGKFYRWSASSRRNIGGVA